MHEKFAGRHPKERPAGTGPSALGPNPAGFHQRIDNAFPESDPPDLFNFRASDRLMVSNHSQGFDRSPRKLSGDRFLDAQTRPQTRREDCVVGVPAVDHVRGRRNGQSLLHGCVPRGAHRRGLGNHRVQRCHPGAQLRRLLRHRRDLGARRGRPVHSAGTRARDRLDRSRIRFVGRAFRG